MTTPRVDPKYQVVRKLREGAQGTVFLVRHRLLDELRVVKVLRSSLDTDQDLRERFLREARAAIHLRHPNIAQLHDFSVDEEGNAAIVLEYVDGLTLDEFGRCPEARDVAVDLVIARQVLSALGYLHGRGSVHRGISPDNLMLTEDVEGNLRVKLIDLGIVRVLRGGDEGAETRPDSGPPRDAPAEPITSPDLDARADLYSLGVLLYELVTGRHPIQGHDATRRNAGQREGEPVGFDVSDPGDRVPPDLRALLASALARSPEERPQSAEEFSEQLAEIATRLPAPSRAETARLLDAARRGARQRRQEALARAGAEILGAVDRGDLAGARERLAAAVEQLGGDPELLELEQRIAGADRQEKLARAERERFEGQLAGAESALAADDLPGALSQVTEALARRPDDARARALAQRIDARRREAERAAEARQRETIAARRDTAALRDAPSAEIPGPADLGPGRPVRPAPPRRESVAAPAPGAAARRRGWLRPVGLVALLAVAAVTGWLLWSGTTQSAGEAGDASPAPAAPDAYARGLAALERGDLAAAAASLRLAVTRDGVERPGYLPYFFLGQALARARSCEEAMRALAISESQGAIQASPHAALLPAARASCTGAAAIDESLRRTETALGELEGQIAAVVASRTSTEAARLWAAEPDLSADFETARKMVERARALVTRARERRDPGLAHEASGTVAEARTRLRRVLGAIELRIGREPGRASGS